MYIWFDILGIHLANTWDWPPVAEIIEIWRISWINLSNQRRLLRHAANTTTFRVDVSS